jgi:hypothetical protein
MVFKGVQRQAALRRVQGRGAQAQARGMGCAGAGRQRRSVTFGEKSSLDARRLSGTKFGLSPPKSEMLFFV